MRAFSAVILILTFSICLMVSAEDSPVRPSAAGAGDPLSLEAIACEIQMLSAAEMSARERHDLIMRLQFAATRFARKKRFEAALEILQALLRFNQEDVRALSSLGHVYMQMGRYHKAVGVFQTVLRIEGETAMNFWVLAEAQYKAGAYGDAVENLRTLMALTPTDGRDQEFDQLKFRALNRALNILVEHLNQVAEAVELIDQQLFTSRQAARFWDRKIELLRSIRDLRGALRTIESKIAFFGPAATDLDRSERDRLRSQLGL